SNHTLPSNSDESEAEKRTQEEERQTEEEPPSPNHNNNNKHSHTPYSNTHSQSGGTHLKEQTSNTTHSRTKTKYTRSHTYTPNRDTHTKTSDTLPETITSHSQSNNTHTLYSSTDSQSSGGTHSDTSNRTGHTLPETSSSHRQSQHTHCTSSNTLPETSSSHRPSHHTHSTESSHTLPETSSSHRPSHHTHSTESSHTLPDTSSSHRQSHHTHSTESSNTLPETSSHTLPETSSSHRQSHHTHSTESSHTLPETSSSHRQSHHTHSTESSHTQNVDTQEKGASPPSCSEQPTCDSRAPIWRPVGALPSPHAPILSQNQHLSSEQGSVSSSQSQVMSDCISSKNSAEDSTEPSVSLLQRRIHNLKQAVRSLDNSFQYTQYYKAGRNDKVADPRVASLMMDLDKARKQLTDLQSRQCVDGSVKLCSSSTVQQGVSVTKPALEDTVKTLTQHLKEKRLELNLAERLQDMSLDQLALEKMTLQKSLLYYESLHGRPRSKEERSVMRDLYDRYHLVKQAFYSSNRQTNTMSGDKGLDKLIQQTLCSTLPTQEASNPAFISQLEEIKLTTAQTNNTHSINRAEILMQLKETRVEKRRQRKILKEFEETVLLKTGKSAQREDRVPMAVEYDRYETLKARLKLLKRMLGQTHTVKAAGGFWEQAGTEQLASVTSGHGFTGVLLLESIQKFFSVGLQSEPKQLTG
ncbi:protein FAM13A-like, partial [Astyanax mexicanus]